MKTYLGILPFSLPSLGGAIAGCLQGSITRLKEIIIQVGKKNPLGLWKTAGMMLIDSVIHLPKALIWNRKKKHSNWKVPASLKSVISEYTWRTLWVQWVLCSFFFSFVSFQKHFFWWKIKYMFSLENLEKHKTVKTSHITILNEIVLIEYTVSLLSLDMSWTFFCYYSSKHDYKGDTVLPHAVIYLNFPVPIVGQLGCFQWVSHSKRESNVMTRLVEGLQAKTC